MAEGMKGIVLLAGQGCLEWVVLQSLSVCIAKKKKKKHSQNRIMNAFYQ